MQYIKTAAIISIYSYIGLAIIIPALIGFTLARIKLGRSFQAAATANILVTSGIYRILRHPIYYFGLLFIFGLIIFIQEFYLLIIWCVFVFVQRSRIKKKEKVLEEKFGEQYLEYKKKTWF